MICSSGLRKARARAKASSMSSPMSASMITFSGSAGTAEDWPKQRGDAIIAREPRTDARMAADLDMLRGMLAREMKTSWARVPQTETLAHRKRREEPSARYARSGQNFACGEILVR